MIEFTADRRTLLATAQKALRCATGRSTLAILNHLLLRVVGSELVITGYDLEVGVQVRCTIDFTGEGEATVPADMFVSLLSSMNGNEVAVSSTNERIILKCGGSNYKLLSLDPQEFPRFPNAETESVGYTVSATTLAQAVKQTIFCANEQRNVSQNQIWSTGVCFQMDNGELKLTCSNQHVLAVKRLQKLGDGNAQVILPATSLSAILPVMTEDCNVQVDFFHGYVELHLNDANQSTCVLRTIAGTYPDYQRIVLANLRKDFVLQCPVLPLRDAVKRVILICGSNPFPYIKISMRDKLRLSVRTRDNGDAVEEIDIGSERDEPYEYWLNAKNLQKVLDAASDTTQVVQWEFDKNNQRPTILRDTDNNWFGLIMPCHPASWSEEGSQ